MEKRRGENRRCLLTVRKAMSGVVGQVVNLPGQITNLTQFPTFISRHSINDTLCFSVFSVVWSAVIRRGIIMRLAFLALSGLLFTTVLAIVQTVSVVTLPKCVLSLDEEVQVPAQEPGVLVKIPVREGQQVTRDELLAQIDDVLPQRQYDVARFKLEVAKKQARDRIEYDFAKAGYDVAVAKLQRSLKSVAMTPKSVSEDVIDEQRLEKEKFRLSIEKAQKDLDVNVLQQQVSEAELRAAAATVERHRLLAPLDAEVIELSRREGEWVQAGETVMRLVRMDRLRVGGYVNIKDIQPSDIQNRPVQVVVPLARGQQKTFPGKIVFVKPLIQVGGDFEVRAEVQNRRDGDSWVLSPGMPAEMTIQLK
jgi:multidrug efflux pump subunit AcrA (membrane-fusion protein)